MTLLFLVGALVGLIFLIYVAIQTEQSLMSLEGIISVVVYPAMIGWLFCFLWKVVQWPFS